MRTLNLGNYTIVPKEDATLKVILFPREDGSTPPPLYLRGHSKTKVVVASLDNIGDIEWLPTVKVDVSGTPENYIQLVDWWFDNAHSNSEYKDYININYGELPTLKGEIAKAKAWLKMHATDQNVRGEPIARREDLNRYLRGWLNRTIRKVRR